MASEKLNTDLLTSQLQAGSEQAFTALYDVFAKPIYRKVLHLIKDEDVAKELLQDLFLNIWLNHEKIDLNKSFKSYLYKIAENLVYMYFRKVAKDKRMIDKLIMHYTDLGTNAEDSLIAKENHQLLQKAIETLSPQRRQVYSLCKLDGLSYDEVSQRLDISTSTIRDHIVKGNKAVKSYLHLNQDIAVLFITAELFKHFK